MNTVNVEIYVPDNNIPNVFVRKLQDASGDYFYTLGVDNVTLYLNKEQVTFIAENITKKVEEL